MDTDSKIIYVYIINIALKKSNSVSNNTFWLVPQKSVLTLLISDFS